MMEQETKYVTIVKKLISSLPEVVLKKMNHSNKTAGLSLIVIVKEIMD